MLHRLPPRPYPILGVLIVALLLVAGGVTLCVQPGTQSTPTVAYASPTGTGSACTESAPCTIATWLASSSLRIPGATLVLEDGTYTGSHNMIRIPSSGFAGTASQPITIRARNEGRVLIDGGYSRPIDLYGSWGILWGIDVTRGDNHNIRFREDSAQWKVQRFVSWDTSPEMGDVQVLLTGTNNLIEDGVIFGDARKPFAAAQNTGSGNTARRIWSRWESNPHQTSNPTNSGEGGYTQDRFRFENVLSTWNLRPGGRVTSPEGIWQMFATRNSQWLGSIAYVQATDDFQPSRLFFAMNDGGSHAQQGKYHNTQNVVVRHNVLYIDPAHPNFAGVQGCRFVEDTDAGGASPDGTGNVVDKLVCIGGMPSTFSSGTWDTPTQIQQGRSLAEALGEGTSLWSDSVAGPGVCRRYQDGVLTETPLWPWAMNTRAMDRMRAAGREEVDITGTMERLFGPLPAACKTGSTPPIPPEPGPTPPVAQAMTCTGTIAAVPGQVVLQCLPQTRR
jgi:hypothetical protein